MCFQPETTNTRWLLWFARVSVGKRMPCTVVCCALVTQELVILSQSLHSQEPHHAGSRLRSCALLVTASTALRKSCQHSPGQYMIQQLCYKRRRQSPVKTPDNQDSQSMWLLLMQFDAPLASGMPTSNSPCPQTCDQSTRKAAHLVNVVPTGT